MEPYSGRQIDHLAGIKRLATADSSSTAQQYAQATQFLFQRINYEKTSDIPYRSEEFKLGRMRELVRRLGDPQCQFPVVHVAGTKGKGSTAELLAQIGQAAGYRIGKFTSPHLERLEERFSINGQLCTEQETIDLVGAIAPIVREMDQGEEIGERLTFFEITTAMAFLYFARQEVDLGVIEVGLGGRLDSTNVCQPRLSIITSISRDHIKTLGADLRQIAMEKAGIIKPGIPAISGVQDPQARLVIAEIAANQSAPLWQLDRDFSVHAICDNDLASDHDPGGTDDSLLTDYLQTFEFRAGGPLSVVDLRRLQLGMKGRHQVRNASLAIMAALLLRSSPQVGEEGFHFSDEAIRQGIASTSLSARIECIATRPTIIVDVAHNDASAEALAEVVDRHFPKGRRYLVYASSTDKQHEEILSPLLPVFHQLWLTRFQNNPRSQNPAKLYELVTRLIAAESHFRCQIQPPMDDAHVVFSEAIDALGPDDLLVVTGSFFIAAEFQRFWQARQAAAPVDGAGLRSTAGVPGAGASCPPV